LGSKQLVCFFKKVFGGSLNKKKNVGLGIDGVNPTNKNIYVTDENGQCAIPVSFKERGFAIIRIMPVGGYSEPLNTIEIPLTLPYVKFNDTAVFPITVSIADIGEVTIDQEMLSGLTKRSSPSIERIRMSLKTNPETQQQWTADELLEFGHALYAASVLVAFSENVPLIPTSYRDNKAKVQLLSNPSLTSFVEVYVNAPLDANSFCNEIASRFNQSMQLSNELKCALDWFMKAEAQLEVLPKFLFLINSLESLARPEKLPAEEIELLKSVAEHLKQLPTTIAQSRIARLADRITGLEKQSIGSSIFKLVETHCSHADADLIKTAYKLRSRLVHQGGDAPELEEKCKKVYEITRCVIENSIKLASSSGKDAPAP
jgi:Apea-like HEPN